jgi:RNA polymerase-binding transcription factor DksA
MNALVARQMLVERRKWWEAIADHMAEDATMDPESNFTLRLALKKLAAIDRHEKRIALGTFGQCERCGGAIEDERLEAILDSEYHYCTTCASKPITQTTARKPERRRVSWRPLPQMT